MRNVGSTYDLVAQHTSPSSSRARGMLTDTGHHRDAVRVVGNPEVMPTDLIRAITSGLPVIRRESMPSGEITSYKPTSGY
jgi:hypothetical protein